MYNSKQAQSMVASANAPSIGRRRGNRRRNRGFWETLPPEVATILTALLLICVGLIGGICLRLVAYLAIDGPNTSPRLRSATNFQYNKYRNNGLHGFRAFNRNAPVVDHNSAPLYPPAIDVEKMHQRRQEYLQHLPILHTEGPFPHYPDGKALVPKSHDFTSFVPAGGNRFEEYKWGDSPYSYQPGESDDLARSRRYHVKEAMKFAWMGYETYAFGMDEVHPKSRSGNNRWGGIGTTLVDSLDTLWLMDMKAEFYRARDWVTNNLDHNKNEWVSTFETTIRSLGGLLSAYDWSGDEVFLEHANDLGKRLFTAFRGNSGLPYGQVNLATGQAKNIEWSGGAMMTAEIGSIQMEYRMLSRLTGVADYKSKSEHVFERLRDMHPANGLYPYFVRPINDETLEFDNWLLTFGAMSDSYYEYMLKVWIQGGQKEAMYRDMYDAAIQGMHDELLAVSSPSQLVYLADKTLGTYDSKMDHLVCFVGGLLALGAYTDPRGLDSDRAQRDLKTAKALTYTCYQMYARMPTGISPEFIQFYDDRDFEPGRGAPHYLLRPEAVESFFILYHLTGDPVYREWGWEVFQALERYCKTTAGYGGLRDVRVTKQDPDDSMESFFLAETLKYLYLLLDPETPIDLLHKHVFNTEAHPFRIFPTMDQDGVKNLLKTTTAEA